VGFLRRNGGGGGKAPATRIFFATDIHGSERCFRKWLAAGRVYDAKCMILGGDITGKSLVPLCRTGADTWEGELGGRRLQAHDEAELQALLRQIADRGAYARVITPEERGRLGSDPAAFDQAFSEAIRERVAQWVALADERLKDSDVASFVMLGNDDDEELADILRSSSTLCYAEDGIVELPGGHEMVTVGYATPTPWNTPRECSEEELAQRIDAVASALERPETAVMNLHCPPRDTNLDQAPQLDENLRPVVTAGGFAVMSVGAAAVRGAIEKSGAALGLHGHVHESPAGQTIGTTMCVNPGSEYGEGILRGAIVDLAEDGTVKRWQITQG
jgi:Icc-related predicted phosphoesterase